MAIEPVNSFEKKLLYNDFIKMDSKDLLGIEQALITAILLINPNILADIMPDNLPKDQWLSYAEILLPVVSEFIDYCSTKLH